MSQQDVFVVMSMDCEPARLDVSDYGWKMSGSGPADYDESAQSIRGYAAIAQEYDLPLSLFVHPEVAAGHPGLFLELESAGACLGLHLHPYKYCGGQYEWDLGYYSMSEQRDMIGDAAQAWSNALGKWPRYFRGGVFSANDSTFGVLRELDFIGGSLSCPGRVLPGAYAVWAGAEPYPHRVNLNFRQVQGDSEFVEVPISVAFGRPTARGDRGEQGYEWPYIPSNQYDHRAVIEDLLARFQADAAPLGTVITNTHNNMDYSDPQHHATRKLRTILESIYSISAQMDMRPIGVTVADICKMVLTS